jgi:Predicted ATPase of the ABC class
MSGYDRGRGRGRGGRGEYYKNKYGGGGRGRGGGHRGYGVDGTRQESSSQFNSFRESNTERSYQDLIKTLSYIDNKSYPAYHDIESSQGGWVCEHAPRFQLFIGRAQSDPYAKPTRCRIVVPAASAQFPRELHLNKIRSIALADYISRRFYSECRSMGADQCNQGTKGGWSGPKGGDIQIAPPTQHVMEQTAVMVHHETGDVIAQFTVNLPARGRTILGQKAIDIFEQVVPHFVAKSLVYSTYREDLLRHHVLSIEDQHWVRNQLSIKGLVAFVPNGAILPRASGADDRPMQDSRDQRVVRFESPESMRVSFDLPNLKTTIHGMGIQKGVNLVVGGGFHGKSTLLSAIQLGVYDKIPGDGREFCVCDESSVKIRAEDGRCVTNVDISSFISNLPFGKGTNNFTTLDASGSTSQASNIIEVR